MSVMEIISLGLGFGLSCGCLCLGAFTSYNAVRAGLKDI